MNAHEWPEQFIVLAPTVCGPQLFVLCCFSGDCSGHSAACNSRVNVVGLLLALLFVAV
jgi:hypothetical protein